MDLSFMDDRIITGRQRDYYAKNPAIRKARIEELNRQVEYYKEQGNIEQAMASQKEIGELSVIAWQCLNGLYCSEEEELQNIRQCVGYTEEEAEQRIQELHAMDDSIPLERDTVDLTYCSKEEMIRSVRKFTFSDR